MNIQVEHHMTRPRLASLGTATASAATSKIAMRVVVTFTAFVMSLLIYDVGHAQATEPAAPATAVVTLEAPAQVGQGEVITLRLRVQGVDAPAGFEAYIAFDRNVTEFAGFMPAPAAPGQSRGHLVVPEVAGGAVVGAYTCSTGPCLQRRQPQASAAATPDLLGEIELLPLAPGRLQIELAHLNVVDAAGQPLAIELPQRTVVVQVAEGDMEFAATAAGWTWRTEAPAATTASVTAADVTQDGHIGHGDIMEVALGWTITREAGVPCGGTEPAADINGDGCVDISDVQAAASFAQDMQVDAAATIQASRVYTVNSTLDEFDSNTNDGVCRTASDVCTLRAAINQANAYTGSNTIRFAIPGEGVHTIQLTDRLPTLWNTTGSTFIDGYSQPGAAPNSDPRISNAKIMIEIRGDGPEAFSGLTISSHGNRVEGLAFYNLQRSIWIYGSGAYENVIVGNFIGLNAAANSPELPDSEQQAHGVHVEEGALGNRIGGVNPAERNVISGNARHGVGFWHVGTDENVVYNNIIGLSPDGLRKVPNQLQGVDMNYGASYNIVGGVEPGQRNIISGNGENGAEITHGVETTQNVIRGNFIGTDVTGEAAPAYTSNGQLGISLHDRIRDNLVSDNVIGNNRAGGIEVNNFGNCCIRDNRIENNWIGVTPGGVSIPNSLFGIRLFAPETRIGPGNHIAYNPVGIQIQDDASIGNTITRNSIYSNTGLGIDIAPIGQINLNDPDDADDGPNARLNYPEFASVTPEQVTGKACGDCTVEIFISDSKSQTYGEGMTFVGSEVADDAGFFTVTVQSVNFGDYLTSTATDIQGNTSEFSRNALVQNPQNSPPVANDDTASTIQGNAVAIDVLHNDTDAEDDKLTVVGVGAAENGAVETDGIFVTYTPTVDFVGTDTFTYTASDGIGGSSMATVTVSVQAGDTLTYGLIISPTAISLTLGGPPVNYSIALKSKPASPVNITIIADAPLVAAPTQLVFNADNWQTPQSITLSTAPDSAAVATLLQTSTVRHSVTSADSNYNNVFAPTVTVELVEQAIWNGVYLPAIASP